jgi:transposase
MRMFKEALTARNQLMLLPPSVDEMVDQSDPVRLFDELTNRLDYGKLRCSYPGGGCPAYPPDVMAKVLIFAYSMGQRSSRKIAALLKVDLRYIWLSGGLKPDFHTVARFRKEKGIHFEELFAQSVRLCMASGLVLLEHVAVDGTKIEAGCGEKSIWDSKRIEKEREIAKKILHDAEETDKNEDEKYGDVDPTKLSEALTNAESRKRAVDEACKLLEKTGKKTISTTDPDSRQMKTRHGIKMSYNVQAAVDGEHQVVVGMSVTQDENDRNQMSEVLEKITANTGSKSDIIIADKGYDSASTLETLDEHEQSGAIAMQHLPKQCDGPEGFRATDFSYDSESDEYTCPEGRRLTFKGETCKSNTNYRMYVCENCTGCEYRSDCRCLKRNKRLCVNVSNALRKKMQSFMQTDIANEATKLRKRIIEPVFGQIKQNRSFRRLFLMGLAGAKSECALIFLAHNLFKIGKYATA